jgi:hypothetical protein
MPPVNKRTKAYRTQQREPAGLFGPVYQSVPVQGQLDTPTEEELPIWGDDEDSGWESETNAVEEEVNHQRLLSLKWMSSADLERKKRGPYRGHGLCFFLNSL